MKFKTILKEYVLPYFGITVGSVIAAFALEEFLVPNTILDGGITGISIMISTLTSWSLGLFIFVLNIPFMCVGFKLIGKQFFFRGAFGMAVFSGMTEVFHELDPITNETVLAVVFGGLLLGIGVGLVLRFGGCLDGTEIVALILSKKFSFSVGQIIFIFNIIIFIVAGLLFGFDRTMYSLLSYFITYKVIDLVENGLEQGKAVTIITDQGATVAQTLYQKLGRTCTLIDAKGLISGKKEMLYCVVTRVELMEIRHVIKEIDGSAFVTISDVSEILGDHIKSKM
ncbi:MAG: YitT family protein [Eubacterium sp.]|nr:YitT family protein [Eubacterium sp.]